MPVETFSRETFEAALPKHKITGQPLWRSLGMQNGEYTYLVPVTERAGIVVRSSVCREGTSAANGEDSIRCWVADPKTQAPLAKKLGRWTTRVKGWEARLVQVLRRLYMIALVIPKCEKCGAVMKLCVSKSEQNPGRMFYSCTNGVCKGFAWVPDAAAANLIEVKKNKKGKAK